MNKQTTALNAIKAVATNWGLELQGNLQLNTSPSGKENGAIYIDGEVYEAYNAYDGKFADAVRAILEPKGLYIEPYTYSVLEVFNV